MSQGLRNLPKNELGIVIHRRIKQKQHGWGYWAAMDAQDSISQANKSKEKAPKTATSGAILTEGPGNIPTQASEAVQVASTYSEVLELASPETQEFVDEHVTGQDSIGV